MGNLAANSGSVIGPPHRRFSSSSLNSEWRDPLLFGLLAFAVSVIGSQKPWFWVDEAATLSIANRSIPQMKHLFDASEAAHGLYFYFMHFWFDIFPVNEFTARLPSSLAVGIAAAGIVVLARQLSTQTVAIVSALIFAVSPHVTWAGVEARVYALTATAAVWVTVSCVTAIRRGEVQWLWWVLYGASLTVSIALNIYLVLMIPVHAVAIWAVSKSGDTARNFKAWFMSVAVALLVLSPYLMIIRRQTGMISWLKKPTQLFDVITKYQYFTVETLSAANIATILLILGSLVAIAKGKRRPSSLVLIAVTWVVFPTAVLVLYSLKVSPVYMVRYLTFTTPALSMLLGASIATISSAVPKINSLSPRLISKVVAGALVLLFAITALPARQIQRTALGKSDGMESGPVADIIDRDAEPGDCLAVDESKDAKRWWALRWLMVPRKEVYEKLNDPGRVGDPYSLGQLVQVGAKDTGWITNAPECTTMWVIAPVDTTLPAHQSEPALTPGPRLEQTEVFRTLRESGFQLVESWQFHAVQLVKMVRKPDERSDERSDESSAPTPHE